MWPSAAKPKALEKNMPKCEENPGMALWAALGTAGTAQASVEEVRVVGRPQRGAALLRRSEGAGDGRGAKPCVGQKATPYALPRRVANTPGPCPLRPRAASLTAPVLALFARVPSLGAPPQRAVL